MVSQQQFRELRSQHKSLAVYAKHFEIKAEIADKKCRLLEEDLVRMKDNYEQELMRLKASHAEELVRINARNEKLLQEVLLATCPLPGHCPPGQHVQLSHVLDGDTGSSSDLASRTDVDVWSAKAGPDKKINTTVPFDPLAHIEEPDAPSPDLVRHDKGREICQVQIQQVLRSGITSSGAASSFDPAQSTAGPIDGKSSPDEHEADSERDWSKDDECLVAMEEREAMEINADKDNDETFGSESCGTDFSNAVAKSSHAVKLQLKAQALLSAHFNRTFGTLFEGIKHLKTTPDVLEGSDLSKKFTRHFGLPCLLASLLDINEKANAAKHPKPDHPAPQAAQSSAASSSEHPASGGQVMHDVTNPSDEQMVQWLSEHLEKHDGCAYTNQLDTLYSEHPEMRDRHMKARVREFCLAHDIVRFAPTHKDCEEGAGVFYRNDDVLQAVLEFVIECGGSVNTERVSDLYKKKPWLKGVICTHKSVRWRQFCEAHPVLNYESPGVDGKPGIIWTHATKWKHKSSS